jgi:hypothetical protein
MRYFMKLHLYTLLVVIPLCSQASEERDTKPSTDPHNDLEEVLIHSTKTLYVGDVGDETGTFGFRKRNDNQRRVQFNQPDENPSNKTVHAAPVTPLTPPAQCRNHDDVIVSGQLEEIILSAQPYPPFPSQESCWTKLCKLFWANSAKDEDSVDQSTAVQHQIWQGLGRPVLQRDGNGS